MLLLVFAFWNLINRNQALARKLQQEETMLASRPNGGVRLLVFYCVVATYSEGVLHMQITFARE